MKILIAEDDENSRILLGEILQGLGHTLMSAPDGKVALQLAQELVPDIIITDILMPEMDGYSLCQQVKSDPKLAHIAVLFYTATYTKEGDEELAEAMGASRFIIKPQDPAAWVEILAGVIKEYKAKSLPVPVKPREPSGPLANWHEKVLIDKLQEKLSDLEKEKTDLFVSREKYRNLVESLKKDFIFFSYNAQGKLVYVSPSVLNISGYSQEEFIDRHGGLWAERSRKQIKNHWLEGPSQSKEQAQFELEITDKNGNTHYLDVKEVPIFDKDQNLIAVDGLAQDITKKKAAEATIRKLYQGIQQSPTAVIITDLEGNIEYANPQFEKMTGYSHSEIWGGNTRIFKSGEQPPEFYEDLWQTISSGKTWHGEFHNKKKNGELFWKRSVITPVLEKDKVINYIDFGEDITQSKASEELLDKTRNQLATSEKLASIGRLAAGVSHEVLNPLNIISVQIQMLQKKVQDNPTVQNYCSKMEKEVGRVTKILGALLSFSRKGDSTQTKIDVRDIIEDVVELVKKNFSLENITIETDFFDSLPELLADKEKLRQVFLNLINNAEQAMPNGGALSIKCHKKQKMNKVFVQTSISDTGQGIKSENLNRIFDPFFTTKPEGEGTGMGLAVVHGIIEEHNGTITVESKEGEGTTFIIDLPV